MSADLFGNEITPVIIVTVKHGKPKENPLIGVYGYHTDATKRCGECKHHYFKEYAKSYPKCTLREERSKHHGASSDHSSRYKACGKFEPKA